MNVYVLAKCIDSEKGDIIIDLGDQSIQIYKFLYQVKEDQEYEITEENVEERTYFQWNILKSYELAFGKNRSISKNGFRFHSNSEKDSIRVDPTGLFYINDLFFGKLMNQKEVEFLEKEGVPKFKAKIDAAKKEGIKLLIRGKKIYRIFTKSKFKSLNTEIEYEQDLLELIEMKAEAERLEKIERIEQNLKQAMDLIIGAINLLKEVKKP